MYDWIKGIILSVIKVPPEPNDPMGSAGSIMVFRASYNFYRYRFYLWMIKNLFGIISAMVVGGFIIYDMYHDNHSKLMKQPESLVLAVIIASLVVLYSMIQTLMSYFVLRLDYELRWYKISDRSLRIREGVRMVREMTMTFANIQNIEIMQGPIQRLFGIADLKVESAGGGFMLQPQGKGVAESPGFHVAYFRGIDNAEEIRDIMRKRLRKIKSSGVGHDDSSVSDVKTSKPESFSPGVVELLSNIRDEAAAFRHATENL